MYYCYGKWNITNCPSCPFLGGMEGGGCTNRGGTCTGRDTIVASLALLTLYLTLGGGKGLAK